MRKDGQLLDRFDDLLRRGTDPPVRGQVSPANDPLRIEDESRWTGDIGAADATLIVDHTPGLDDSSVNIGEDWEIQAEALADLGIAFDSVNRNRHQLGAGFSNILKT